MTDKKEYYEKIYSIIMILLCVTALIAFGAAPAFAEFEDKNLGVRSSSMGGAYSGLADDGEGLFYNPAGISKIKRAEFTSMHTTLFAQSELALDYFNFTQPMMPFGTVSFGYTRFGSGLYTEKEIAMSLSRAITESHHFGLTLKQLSAFIENTPDRNAFSMDFGFIVNFEKNFSAGISVLNLNNPKMNEVVPKTYKAGIAFAPKENLTLCLDYSKQSTEGKGSINIGEEFKLTRNFKIRAGYSTYPARFSTGFGFEFKNIKLDYGFRNHDTLNSTHRVSFTYMMD